MSKRIAILSDTHDVLRQEVIDAIKGCDAILHAGDVCDEDIMDQLRACGPVYVVRGNNDFGWAASLSKTLTFQIEGLRFFMTHMTRNIPHGLKDIDILIYGHTHKYSEEWVGDMFWFNPGSAGWARYNNELSFAIMTIDGKKFSIEKHVLKPDKKPRFFW
ncbi:MAG: metallophosphatase family protein [Lachnospiraceae bacterium]|nr:metallophosphatase family protein [Lachnospiraceae bacterium]